MNIEFPNWLFTSHSLFWKANSSSGECWISEWIIYLSFCFEKHLWNHVNTEFLNWLFNLSFSVSKSISRIRWILNLWIDYLPLIFCFQNQVNTEFLHWLFTSHFVSKSIYEITWILNFSNQLFTSHFLFLTASPESGEYWTSKLIIYLSFCHFGKNPQVQVNIELLDLCICLSLCCVGKAQVQVNIELLDLFIYLSIFVL